MTDGVRSEKFVKSVQNAENFVQIAPKTVDVGSAGNSAAVRRSAAATDATWRIGGDGDFTREGENENNR